ncbi:uridine 5'-monophosphate synthase-like [Acanthaster planci]|uniref:Uridine 5'-monophosphate synthase n=1 Tax=Acanthaster planci TaxID=133434 RepID=A0A8B7Y358_ACAPL|nr:uridine 5'-monophosphate synthase-like [Acanthaster planci]
MDEARLVELVLKLYKVEAVKFGSFTLKSGIQSPVYFDLRVMVSYPEIMDEVSELLWEASVQSKADFSVVCGVPYTALPLATLIAVNHKKPMVIRRKEAKDYGTKKMIEGAFQPGDHCLIVEDVVTSGGSVMETAQSLNAVGMKVKDAVVLLDRSQGGKNRLEQQGIRLQSVLTLPKVLQILEDHGKLEPSVVAAVKQFIVDNTFPDEAKVTTPEKPSDAKKPRMSGYETRAELCQHLVAKQLFTIMAAKKTNLAFSADLTSCQQVLQLADKVGPHICLLKTHVDILEDFSAEFVSSLTALASKHNFLIFEDRKFADIGNTVKHQYGSGLYKIADWAHITNAHAVPGAGVVQGLKEVGVAKGRACLLIGQMSSAGNLATGEYTQSTVKMAEDHTDFVIGFICTSALSSDPKFIHMTPGVKLAEGNDALGQQYLTPEKVIAQQGSDIIIVGRGIYQAADPVAAAQAYREAGYSAYLSLLS